MQANRSSVLRAWTRLQIGSGAIPPTGLVLLAIFSVQIGAAIAKHLFDTLGPAGTVFLRAAFAALMLFVIGRPRFRGHERKHYLLAALFGFTIAAMNLSFYSAIARIPLGVAVTIEFVGPLGVAILGSRRILDFVWALLAGIGILLLSPFSSTTLDPVGLLFALMAGCGWAAYIILGGRVGRVFPGGTGLTLALCVSSVVLLPFGIASAGSNLLDPRLLLLGFGVAMFSSAIPFSLEFEALKRIPSHVFGILMSLEPAVASLVGVLLLGEMLEMREIAAIVLVTIAAAGASRNQRPTE